MPGIFDAYDPPLGPFEKIIPWIAILAGLLFSIFTRSWDYWRLRQHKAADITPEDKLASFAFAAPSLAIGLWWFAWTVPDHEDTQAAVSWVVPAMSLVFIGWALNEFDMVLAGYLTDTYNAYSSSAFGAMNLVRCVLSSVFPLVAPKPYGSLGTHLAGTVLAAAATAFCLVPPIFLRYGAAIRGKSKVAVVSAVLNNEDQTMS
ncbi:Efflux pump FUB11 [Fulvia fulva]|uniref:Efflux pump FUB11 n=1 Tax=Passalora fulva TaxID=5499 RepID=A0A9Q8PIY7_PASFU|nr:Efflux pump FUB11 [Fulvia fulva]KAK4611566.1 Efflux pump FUB11 [Fulvia fulva]KAK4612667.1 Efflux pump FUB11 [Fulvia fulva]UJO23519.1 Efflux pump FUB11 [Fulvia fulva]WPV20948.1 Efflux pump FUB11 [Fulvia fulva]WPV36168.1 Efflux pump FUB11 [Fulvia fulva]